MTIKEIKQPEFMSEKFMILGMLKHNPINSPYGDLTLMPAKPYEFNILFYEQAFTNPAVTQYLTISTAFSGREYIEKMNGQVGQLFGGSWNDALFHIYTPRNINGPVGHLSVKNIDWETMSFERGTVIDKPYQSQGIGSKAGYTLLHAMQKYGFQKAHIAVKKENTHSLYIARKQFYEEGTLDEKGIYHFALNLTQPLLYNPYKDS